MTPQEFADCLTYQTGALYGFLKTHGMEMSHIKPHGSAYVCLLLRYIISPLSLGIIHIAWCYDVGYVCTRSRAGKGSSRRCEDLRGRVYGSCRDPTSACGEGAWSPIFSGMVCRYVSCMVTARALKFLRHLTLNRLHIWHDRHGIHAAG